MDKHLLDDTIVYLRKELTRINGDLTWADGAQADAFKVRQKRLTAELDRLESMQCASPAMQAAYAGRSLSMPEGSLLSLT